MKAILKKLAEAKAKIKQTKHKKMGHNSFSNYNYFLPEQIEQMVHEVCAELGLLVTFSLNRSQFGIEGVLTIWDVDAVETITFIMATAIPEIKATNTAQQLGGCMTYTERYLKMSAFGIAENNLDFDNTTNAETPAQQKPAQGKGKEPEKWLNVTDKGGVITPEWKNVLDGISSGIIESVKDVREYYKVSKTVAEAIEKELI